jgi:hypothetical protein
VSNPKIRNHLASLPNMQSAANRGIKFPGFSGFDISMPVETEISGKVYNPR